MSPHAARNHYEKVYMPQLDALKVDQILRWPKKSSPSRGWIYQRANLNRHKISVFHFESDRIILRLK